MCIFSRYPGNLPHIYHLVCRVCKHLFDMIS
jgi:hypothetical protein